MDESFPAPAAIEADARVGVPVQFRLVFGVECLDRLELFLESGLVRFPLGVGQVRCEVVGCEDLSKLIAVEHGGKDEQPCRAGEVHVVVVGEGCVGRARFGATQRDLVWVPVGVCPLVNDPRFTASAAHQRFGRRGDGQPEALVSWVDLQRHRALVPQRRVATEIVLVHRHDACTPIGVRLWIVIAFEIDGDLLRALIGHESRNAHTERIRGFCRRAAIDAFDRVHRNQERPVHGAGVGAELIFLLTVELRESGTDLSHQVAHAADGVFLAP